MSRDIKVHLQRLQDQKQRNAAISQPSALLDEEPVVPQQTLSASSAAEDKHKPQQVSTADSQAGNSSSEAAKSGERRAGSGNGATPSKPDGQSGELPTRCEGVYDSTDRREKPVGYSNY